MSSRESLLLALLCMFSPGETLAPFVQPEKELIYDYQANINVGSYKPANFESQFILHGKLHLQNQNDIENTVFMKFSDLKFKLYNGKINLHDEYKSIFLPLPKEAEHLLKTFQVSYNRNGTVKYFASQSDDLKFSTDLKKAIASIIQIDEKQIKYDTRTPYAFMGHEDSIYGNVVAKYNILPQESGLLVQKMIDVQSANKWISFFGITDNSQYENYVSKQPFSVDAHREYHLVNEEQGYVLKKIKAQGGLYTHMMKGFSESQYLLVNQTMTLLETIPIMEKFHISNEGVKDDLLYKLNVDENDETFIDLTFGRKEVAKEQYENVVLDILRVGANHLKFNHLTPQAPDLEAGQSVNRLLRLMAMLDLNSLEKLFTSLNKKTDKQEEEMFQLYQEMIPLIGTQSSIVFLCDLIKKQKVSDDVAISMLSQMPFHLQMPSKKLLRQVEDLTNLENVNAKVHETAILSFATLVNKVFSHYLMKNDLVKSEDKEDLLDKYILKYLQHLKSADNYSQQYLYIQGLYNIKIGNVVKYLEPYVRGEATTNRHLRYLAMCASYTAVVKDPQRVYEIYWPIFTDSSLHLEIRAAAYLIIITSKPDRTKMYDIYSVLKQDPCPELYHMHYFYLKSIVKSQGNTEDKVIAKEILNFMRIPYKGANSGFYLSEYTDSKFGFGAINNIMVLSTNTSRAYFLDLSTDNYNYPVTNYGLWLKVDGVDTTMLNKDTPSFNTIEQVMKLLNTIKDQKNLHIEYALLQNDKIIELKYFNHGNINKFLSNMQQKLKLRPTFVLYQLMVKQIMPNDMGLPSLFEFAIPTVLNVNTTVTPINEFNQQMNYKVQKASHAAYGISFYNPVCDTWHGVNKFQTNEVIISVNLKLSIINIKKIKLTYNKQDDNTIDKYSIRNYATSLTFVYKDIHDYLQKSNNKCEHFAKITHGKQYENSKTIFDHHYPHSGMQIQIEAFDTHHHISRSTIKKAVENIVQKYFKNYETTGFIGYMTLIQQNIAQYLFPFPEVGNFGLLIRIIPSKIYPVNHVDLTLEFDLERIDDSALTTHKAKINFATKTKDDAVIRMWDINTVLTIDEYRSIYSYKLNYFSQNPEKIFFIICMTGQQKKINAELIAQHTISLGYTVDPTVCVNNEGLIEINMKAEQSDEQNNLIENKKTYDICLPMHMKEPVVEMLKIRYEKNLECTIQKTTLRKYEYNIKQLGLNLEFIKKYHENTFIIGMLFPYYSYENEINSEENNTMKIVINYPIDANEVDIDIMTENVNHKITSMPIPFGFYPKNYHFSNAAINWDEMATCRFEDQHIFNADNELLTMIDEEWIKVLDSNSQTNSNHSIIVYAMKIDASNQYAFRIQTDDEDLQLHTGTNGYKITLNNEPFAVTKGSYQQKRSFSIELINDEQNTIIIKFENFPLYIDYDGNSARIYKARVYYGINGICFRR